MNLLIKIANKDLNIYDILNLADEITAQIAQPKLTEIVITVPRQPIDTKYRLDISQENGNANLINSHLDNYKWDILLPIIEPFTPFPKFDDNICELYQKFYPTLDGVLWLNDGVQKNICTLPVIGRKYYEEFGYVYNPAYSVKNFDKEFTEILKLKKAYTYVNDVFFGKKIITLDDDNIYQFREKYHFGLEVAIDSTVVSEPPKPVIPQNIEPTTGKKIPPPIPEHKNPKHPTVRFTRKHLNSR
jgi:hypothetical protein